jgi:patatin-like phospholipase/acyl hydrolase
MQILHAFLINDWGSNYLTEACCMLHPFSIMPSTLQNIENSLSEERLSRYLLAAGNDRHRAVRLYIWNARLCESFYLPCQIAEVTIRNSIHRAFTTHFNTADWYKDQSFRNQLNQAHDKDLSQTVYSKTQDHRQNLTCNHIISGLSFGFWSHMLTKNFQKCGIWPAHIHTAFPFSPKNITINQISKEINDVRCFRNRIAHQGAIFDKSPQRIHQSILNVIGWSCADSRWLTETVSRLNQTINARPRF